MLKRSGSRTMLLSALGVNAEADWCIGLKNAVSGPKKTLTLQAPRCRLATRVGVW